MTEPWSVERMYQLGSLHAKLEGEQNLDALMDTMILDPVYEFYPLRKALRGGEKVRRYYRQFMDQFMSTIVDYSLIEEWVNTTSVIQEYDITVSVDGARQTHRTVGVLFAEGSLLGGERIYGSEAMIRQFAGAMFDELEDI